MKVSILCSCLVQPRTTGCVRSLFAAAAMVAVGATSIGRADEPAVKCGTCHAVQAGELAGSVHARQSCVECHGGTESYSLSEAEIETFRAAVTDASRHFEHGAGFRGKPERRQIPERCGTCHADVARMNPYGLRTDQLVRYRTSGHGKTLGATGDERVAVCVDCHGSHGILSRREPASKTHPLNIPDTCAVCHADAALMGEYGLPVEVVDEYRRSVHGRLLLEQRDTGAPTCASCHGNHSAVPPGFATVGAVCGKCHQDADEAFAGTPHAKQDDFKGCLQCHGGGEGSHHHLERVTLSPGLLRRRYEQLTADQADPTAAPVMAELHPAPRKMFEKVLPSCMECHEEIEEDEALQGMVSILDSIAESERTYASTAVRLEKAGQGVLLVDSQRFTFEDAKTHMIGLASIQHTLDAEKVGEKVAELNAVCKQVETELDQLEADLRWRHTLLVPIWLFAAFFAAAMYIKFKQLKHAYVELP